MTKEIVPIPLVLDLWSLGHSAGDIAKRLDIPGGHKGVTRVVMHARSIGDKRAIVHTWANNRVIGRNGRNGQKVRKGAKTLKGREVTMIIPRQPPEFCLRGHVRRAGSCHRCLECARESAADYRKRKREEGQS